MSRRLIAINVVLATLAMFFAAWLARDLAASRPLPGPPAPRKTAASAPSDETSRDTAAQERLAAYDVIVAKYLFNPSRTEGRSEPAKPAVPLPPKPTLLGVVVDSSGSRAYLEDPSTKRVSAYLVGDSVAGGTLERITNDRVQISRPDGLMDVILRDPSKPAPAPPTPGPTRGPVPVTPGTPSRTP